MISSMSMSSVVGEGIAMHDLESQSVRPGHVVATLLIFQLFKYVPPRAPCSVPPL
jgi:hypothetical protein